MFSRLLTRRSICMTVPCQLISSRPLSTTPTIAAFQAAQSARRAQTAIPVQPRNQTKHLASMASSNTKSVTTTAEQFMNTSGAQDPVWIKDVPYSSIPTFPSLNHDLETDVLIIGSGISGVSIAYELVRQGVEVTMIEARHILSGETGRTSGHLASDLDDGYTAIASMHGKEVARIAAESHDWAAKRVGQISKELGIECEYRQLKGYDISQFEHGTKDHDKDIETIKEDMEAAKEAGLVASYLEGFKVQGWDGQIDQRDAVVYENQATFHPTKYVVGILEWLKKQDKFQAFSSTRAVTIKEKGVTVPIVNVHIGPRDTVVEIEGGHKITAAHTVEATCVPLQRLSLVAEMEYMRTYCIAIRIPKGIVEDCLLYDSEEAYKYIRMTECDSNDEYMVIGGCDHAVGQEDAQDERYNELEEWVRKRFTKAGAVDYRWSGQIFDPIDHMAYIGRNSGQQKVYVVTGDSGNGLTHGVIAGKIISDMITGQPNAWEKGYDPRRRTMSTIKSAPAIIKHDLQANSQYKRFLQNDINDIEDLGNDKGGVLNSGTKKPIAVYRDENGKVHRMSALCPHMKGVVCWNDSEKSWDCPVHGSRFSKDGKQIIGPANVGMHPEEQNELKTGFMQ